MLDKDNTNLPISLENMVKLPKIILVDDDPN